MNIFPFLVIILILLAQQSADAVEPPELTTQTIYVSQSSGDDINDGTSETKPWKTLAKASMVNWRPGDKLLLKCGDTWNEGLTLRGDGSATAPVTVASYAAGERPLIQRTKGNRTACILIDKASGYHIRDLELSFAQNAIRIEADSRVKTTQGDYLVENCFIHDTAGNPDFRGGDHFQYVHMGWAIYTDGMASPQPVKLKNFTVRNCVGLRTQGFYMPQGSVSQENWLFDGCTIAHNSFNSVYQNSTRKFDIINSVFVYGYPWEYHPNGSTMVLAGGLEVDATGRNVVTNNEFGWAGDYPGRPDGCGYDFEAGTSGVTFQRNFIHNSFGEAVLFMGGYGHKDLICDGNIFRNNVRFSTRWHEEVTVSGNGGNGVFSNNQFFSRLGIKAFAGKPKGFTFTNNDEQSKGDFVEIPLITHIERGAGERTYTLASRTPGANIRYTLDGSLPTTSSKLYAGPVKIHRSGVLNAKAFKEGFLPSYVNSLGVELRSREGEPPVAWWKLDETSGTKASDSASSNHGALSGCKWMGGGLQFISAEDKVAIDKAKLSDITDNFTLVFWVNPKGPRTAKLFASSFSFFPIGEAEGGEEGKAGQRYALSPKDPRVAGGAGVGVSVGDNGIGVYERAEGYLPPVLTLDTPLMGWNHITVVYRTKQPTIYLNGIFERAGLKSTRSVRPVFDLGGSELGQYEGGLADVRIYDRALTDGEIQEIFSSSVDDKLRR